MREKLLIATVGLPRSGKSTWCYRLILDDYGWPVVNPDSIRLALTGRRFFGPAEPTVWATAKLMVRSLFFAGHHTVVLDATNTEELRRKEWLSSEWSTRWKIFSTPVEECIARAEECGYTDLVPVIERMAETMTFPTEYLLEENYKEI